MFGSACLVMAQVQFSLMKKTKKIGRPEHLLLSPTALRLITSHFCFNTPPPPPSPPPPRIGRHMCITPNPGRAYMEGFSRNAMIDIT